MKNETATSKEATVRRIQIDGTTTMVKDDKAVTQFLAPMQPRWKDRDEKAKRIHLGGWFWNQGERSRLLVRGGHNVGRIDCVRGAA